MAFMTETPAALAIIIVMLLTQVPVNFLIDQQNARIRSSKI